MPYQLHCKPLAVELEALLVMEDELLDTIEELDELLGAEELDELLGADELLTTDELLFADEDELLAIDELEELDELVAVVVSP